jgi:serine phosphatase RsbU (regulator of sigma subunit)
MRLRQSLALAQEVQQNLLPSGTPNIKGLDLAGHATYCDETGGVWEAFNTNTEMFGKDRVRDLIRRFADLSAAEICERMKAELSNFLGDTHPDDDLTFVIVKVL